MEDIQSIVRNDLHKININIDTDEKLGISFDPETGSPADCRVFADMKGYHFCPGPGEKGSDRVYANVGDLLYQVYLRITYSLASRYAADYHREFPNTFIDPRQTLLTMQLQLLKTLGTEYYRKRDAEISRLVREHL